jgi:CDP-diacylglycerol--serine O-phosphatidyltransferase
MILGAYNLACLLTLSGLVAAIGAVVLSSAGEMELALVGLMLAGLADLFDGFVARRLRRSEYEQAFGVQIDTVVDVVSFVVTPFVIALNAGPRSALLLGAMTVFAVAGAVRLAHFNTLSTLGADQSTHHRGLPVTYTALIFPVLFIARDLVAGPTFSILLGTAFLLIGALFVIDVPIRKPRGVFYALFPGLGVLLIAYWTWRSLVTS